MEHVLASNLKQESMVTSTDCPILEFGTPRPSVRIYAGQVGMAKAMLQGMASVASTGVYADVSEDVARSTDR